MAQYQNHISFSVIIGICYAIVGHYFFHIYAELLILSAVILAIAGILPDIDASQSSPAKELAGLIAALTPVFLLEYYPKLHTAGTARIALVVICSYLLTRLVVVRVLESFTKHRGMIHSIPAAIVLFEVIYFAFSDLYYVDRLFLATAAFIGFLSHLLLDGYGNLDIIGAALGKSKPGQPALKLVAPSFLATFLIYAVILGLGWQIAGDFFPKNHKVSVKAK